MSTALPLLRLTRTYQVLVSTVAAEADVAPTTMTEPTMRAAAAEAIRTWIRRRRLAGGGLPMTDTFIPFGTGRPGPVLTGCHGFVRLPTMRKTMVLPPSPRPSRRLLAL